MFLVKFILVPSKLDKNNGLTLGLPSIKNAFLTNDENNVMEASDCVINDIIEKNTQQQNDTDNEGIGLKTTTIDKRNDRVLKLLNSNIEDPYIIWDNSTRTELLDFVETHRSSNINTVLFCLILINTTLCGLINFMFYLKIILMLKH